MIRKMKNYADSEDTITSHPFSEFPDAAQSADVVLLGPQMRFKLKEVEAVSRKCRFCCAVIDMNAYGRIDGEAVYEQAKHLYEEEKG